MAGKKEIHWSGKEIIVIHCSVLYNENTNACSRKEERGMENATNETVCNALSLEEKERFAALFRSLSPGEQEEMVSFMKGLISKQEAT